MSPRHDSESASAGGRAWRHWYSEGMLERFGWRRRHEPVAADETPADDAADRLILAGTLVHLREHVPANKSAFQRWYADPEIANLLRHDLEPLSAEHSASYFDSIILPLSHRHYCYAIHEAESGRLVGTTALTDIVKRTTGRRSALFRIVIGEKDVWDRGYGTEATRLVVEEAFSTHDLTEVRLEVFRHNPRAITAYERVGFRVAGEHVEWVGRSRRELHVIEMRLRRGDGEQDDFEPAAEPAFTLVDDDAPTRFNESSDDQTARIARRRHLRQARRTPRETTPEDEESITSGTEVTSNVP